MLRYMSLIIPDGYAQVVLGFRSTNLFTGRGAITLGFGAPLGEDPLPLDVFAINIEDAMEANFGALFDTQVTFDSVYVANETESVLRSVSVTGGQNFEDPPPNVAVLVSKVTAAKGRRGRGRVFLYGVCGEGDIDTAGNLAGARRTSVQNNWDDFIDSILNSVTTFGVQQVILQSTTPTGPGAPANPTPPISPPPVVTSSTVSGRVATQRRRLRR